MKFNAKGFSIAEVMIAIGLLGMVSVGVMHLTTTMTKGQKKLAQDFEANQVSYRVANILANEIACNATFVDVPSPIPVVGGSVDEIKNHLNRTIYKVKDEIGAGSQGRLILEAITTALPRDKTEAIISTDFAFPIVIRLTFSKKSVSAGSTTFVREINAFVVADENKNIQSCQADKKAYNEAFCTSLGGTWNANVFRCEDIKVNQAAGPAITALGDLEVQTSIGVGTNASGNVGSITAKEILTAGPKVQIAETLGVGTTPPTNTGDLTVGQNALVENNLTVNKSIGVGMAAPDQPGDLYVNQNVMVANGLGVGLIPPSVPGQIETSSNIIVGGNARVAFGLGVGVDAPSTTGSIQAGKNISAGGQISTDGTGSLGNDGTIHGKYIYAYDRMYTEGGSNSFKNDVDYEVPNKRWVSKAIADNIAQNVDNSMRQEIATKILNYVENNQSSVISKLIKESIDFPSTYNPCPSGKALTSTGTGTMLDGFDYKCEDAADLVTEALGGSDSWKSSDTTCDISGNGNCHTVVASAKVDTPELCLGPTNDPLRCRVAWPDIKLSVCAWYSITTGWSPSNTVNERPCPTGYVIAGLKGTLQTSVSSTLVWDSYPTDYHYNYSYSYRSIPPTTEYLCCKLQ